MIKPREILIFILSVFAGLFVVSYVVDNKEIVIYKNYSVTFPSYKSFIEKNEKQYADISKIIAVEVEVKAVVVLVVQLVLIKHIKQTMLNIICILTK